jgi:hypothetical protein
LYEMTEWVRLNTGTWVEYYRVKRAIPHLHAGIYVLNGVRYHYPGGLCTDYRGWLENDPFRPAVKPKPAKQYREFNWDTLE